MREMAAETMTEIPPYKDLEVDEWKKRPTDSFEEYGALCEFFREPMLTKKALSAIANQVTTSSGFRPLGRPYIRYKSCIMGWLQRHRIAVDQVIRVAPPTLPTQRRLQTTSAARMRRRTQSRANSPTWRSTEEIRQVPPTPLEEAQTFELDEVPDYEFNANDYE
jgi:hypothetical protein